MLKHLTVITFAVALCAPAIASPNAQKSDPLLSGSYVYFGSENCASVDGSLHQISGTISFDPSTGKAKANVFAVTGQAPELLGIKSTSAFTNGGGLLTLGSQSYHIAYGQVQNGIATYASFIGLVQDGSALCGYQGTISMQ
jgi:hypothetical protein